MSVKCTTWVWDHSPTTGNDRIVLVFLADQADDDGTNAYPSIERIAAKANVPVRTVMRCIERMEASGALRVIRPAKRGRGRFNHYVVLMDSPMKGVDLTCGQPPPDGASSEPHPEPETRENTRNPALPYLNGHRSMDPLTHNPCPDGRATEDVPPPDLRAGLEATDQEPQPTAAPDLLAAVADAAPPTARYELLDDPDQAAGRAALRRRLSTLAAAVGLDAAVAVVAGEWPAAVASPMAHANARARAALDGPSTPAPRRQSVGANPLDGIADATAALAERARAREAELADEPPLVVPSGWKALLRGQLYPTEQASR